MYGKDGNCGRSHTGKRSAQADAFRIGGQLVSLVCRTMISFDISEVLLETDMGMLKIQGADLHVNRLTLEKGEIDLEGRIDSIQYSEVSDFKKGGETLLNRLFR